MEKVLQQYVQHYVRILFKPRQGKTLTHAEKMGVAYYKAAAQRVQVLIDAPTPEWVGLQFSKSRYTR
jgi:hypothetical protein